MTRRPAARAIGMILAWGAASLAVADEGPFRALPLDEARRIAGEEGKRLVLIDVYTTWCAPCKQLDETTWKDAEVRAWLAETAVSLKVDAEEDEALAERFRVNAYPTLLLLKPDGTEIDRLVGYRDPGRFLADARDALAGNDGLSRARKALEGDGRDDPMLRQSYGDALAEKGRLEDALSEYFWCFDHGLEHRRSYRGVRLSFLLAGIVRLGQDHPPALDALRVRRDDSRKALEAGSDDFDLAMGFRALNQYLGEPGQTLSLYDRIKADAGKPARIVRYLAEQSLDQLLAARRYAEAVAAIDPVAAARLRIERHEEEEARFPDDARLRAYMKKQVGVDGAKYYEALLGAGDKAGAAEVARLLAAFDRDGAYPALIAAARRAGDDEAADDLAARQAREAAGPEGDGTSDRPDR